jgi:hypothetical protein
MMYKCFLSKRVTYNDAMSCDIKTYRYINAQYFSSRTEIIFISLWNVILIFADEHIHIIVQCPVETKEVHCITMYGRKSEKFLWAVTHGQITLSALKTRLQTCFAFPDRTEDEHIVIIHESEKDDTNNSVRPLKFQVGAVWFLPLYTSGLNNGSLSLVYVFLFIFI